MVADTHTATAGTHYWTDPDAWTHTEAGHIPEDGDVVAIPTGCIIYFDDDHSAWATGIDGITITSTGELHFALNGVDEYNSLTATYYPNSGANPPFLMMKTAKAISGTGKLYIGDSAVAPIPRPTAAATYPYNAIIDFHGAASSAAIISVTGGVFIYGYIPTAPAAHPAYSALAANAATGTATLVLTEDMGLQKGEQILVSSYTAAQDANLDIYTIDAYVAGTKTITLTANLATYNRVIGDYVAIYSRPIKLFRSTFQATPIISSSTTVAGTVVQGALFYNSPAINFSGLSGPIGARGCTVDGVGGNTASCISVTSTIASVYDSVGTNFTSSGNGLLNMLHGLSSGCFLHYGRAFDNGSYSRHINAVVCSGCNDASVNGSYGYYIGLVARNIEDGFFSTMPAMLYNCSFAGGNYDIRYPSTASNRSATVLYNTTLGATVSPVISYTSYAAHPAFKIQSYNHNGTAGYRRFWGRGGYGLTDATVPYGAADTMKFVPEVVNTPMVWDQPFTLPANKSLTFTVPMRAPLAEAAIVTGEVWVIRPYNDPLFADPFRTLTPTVGTTQGSITATYVEAIAQMPEPDNTWHPVTVTIPASSVKRDLIARVIVKSTTTGAHYCYAYLDDMENALLVHKQRFI